MWRSVVFHFEIRNRRATLKYSQITEGARNLQASTLQLLLHMRMHVKFMRDTMDKGDKEEDLFDLWERVCWRLDIMCLVIFQSFNMLFFVVWFLGAVFY
jgi:hypothetical protein